MAAARGSLGSLVANVLQGGPPAIGVPARVTAEIARREDAAERVIGWAQLAVVSVFAALYAVAPRAEGAAGESFVTVTLAAYFAFTLFRLALSYRYTLPAWFLILSIFVDVALLCGLIFSFHITYAQPPAFYLKAPTMIYFFVFISLRALRFDPRYVLAAGLAATLGWVAMVTYALMSDMGKMAITRNYVEYLTSNSILIGAEIDKAMALVAVTAVLSLALYRGRAVLFDAIASRAAADDLSQFFAPDVATSITHSDSLPGAGRSEMRQVAILFVDVRGFSATARRMPPEGVMAVLSLYQEIALAEIERHGGQIDKFMGDGILATFGAVQDSDTHAADALRAAAAVIAALDAAQDRFTALGWPGVMRTGTGAASGEVTVGVIGAQGRLEFTVIGNPVNLAAKLENANKQMGTRALTDRSTLAAALAQGYADMGLPVHCGVAVTGLADPVDIVVVA